MFLKFISLWCDTRMHIRALYPIFISCLGELHSSRVFWSEFKKGMRFQQAAMNNVRQAVNCRVPGKWTYIFFTLDNQIWYLPKMNAKIAMFNNEPNQQVMNPSSFEVWCLKESSVFNNNPISLKLKARKVITISKTWRRCPVPPMKLVKLSFNALVSQ